MSWFRLESTFASHRKVKQAARTLGIHRIQTGGHIISLFCRVCEEAPDGCLDGWETEDVEEAAQWDGKSGEFFNALAKVGFLVESESSQGSWEINDWMEYAEGYKNAQRTRAYRERKRTARERHSAVRERHGDIRESHGATRVRNGAVDRTGPDQTGQDRTKDLVPSATRSELPVPDVIDKGPPITSLPIRCKRSKGEGKEHPVYQGDLASYAEAYPAVDVLGEVRKMKAWLMSNPERQKTARGMAAFMNRWLSKAQDRAHPPPGRGGQKGWAATTVDMMNEAAAEEAELPSLRLVEGKT